MSFPDTDTIVMFGLAALMGSILILTLAYWGERQRRIAGSSPRWQPADIPLKYEFQNGYLISEGPVSDCFLSDPENRSRAWDDLVEGLSDLNPSLRDKLACLRNKGQAFCLTQKIGPDEVSITGATHDDLLSVTVAPLRDLGAKTVLPRDSIRRLEAELDDLRQSLDLCAAVMWKCDASGDVIWANSGYFDLLAKLQTGQETLFWPLPNIFETALKDLADGSSPLCCELSLPDGMDGTKPHWWEVFVSPLSKGEQIFSALPIDRAVQAEQGKREFVQTFAKTFAQLPVGLAIFDKSRSLVMFNPALMQLTTLSASWLSGRPLLFDFLDQLREHQRMPEPKNYKAWRANLAEIEKGSENGTYQEYWTLPTGQTYRVMGRPHPDGAVALMFEDISSEVSLTRKFRADMELYQTLLDQTPTAMAVFSSEGKMEISNAGFDQLWQINQSDENPDLNLRDVIEILEQACAPTPLWSRILECHGDDGSQATWQDRVQTLEGQVLDVTFSQMRPNRIKLEFASGVAVQKSLKHAAPDHSENQVEAMALP